MFASRHEAAAQHLVQLLYERRNQLILVSLKPLLPLLRQVRELDEAQVGEE